MELDASDTLLDILREFALTDEVKSFVVRDRAVLVELPVQGVEEVLRLVVEDPL